MYLKTTRNELQTWIFGYSKKNNFTMEYRITNIRILGIVKKIISLWNTELQNLGIFGILKKISLLD